MGLSGTIYSYYKPVADWFSYFISVENKIDVAEAFTRIEQEAIYADGVDRKAFWGGFSRNELAPNYSALQKAVELFEKEDIKDKIALDLGAGKSLSTLYLLEKGWKVIAVDYSQEALENLKKLADRVNPEWVQNGQLALVCQKIEKYSLPKKITMIVIGRTLPYVNPLKIRALWDNLHDSLEDGGRLVGHFFPRLNVPGLELSCRALMGGWLTDMESVRALLDHKNYNVEICEYSDFWFNPSRNVEFVAQKGESEPKEKNGFFTMRLSSYFNAVRGLPSKENLPHSSAFFADRCVELKETSKLAVFASGTAVLAQALLGADPTSAAYAFIGSMGASFLFKKLVQRIEPQAKAYISKARQISYKTSRELDAEMQKIKSFQSHQLIQKLFNPPPPNQIPEGLARILESQGIDPNNVVIKELSVDLSLFDVG